MPILCEESCHGNPLTSVGGQTGIMLDIRRYLPGRGGDEPHYLDREAALRRDGLHVALAAASIGSGDDRMRFAI